MFCLECLILHVGVPQLVAGPSHHFDSPVSFVQLQDRSFRGFVGNGSTWRLEGPSIRNLTFTEKPVIGPERGDCGVWIMHVEKGETPSNVLGWTHIESGCGTPNHSKRVGFAESFDSGLSFQRPHDDTVLTPSFPSHLQDIGEGDFGIISHDNGLLLYALQAKTGSWRTIVARSEAGKPGTWSKFYEGSFSEPGNKGEATPLNDWALFPIKYTGADQPYVVLFAADPWAKGLRLSVGPLPAGPFESFGEPLLPLDDSTWNRPAPTELYSYVNAVNDKGKKEFSRHFHLFSSVVLPNESFDRRYLLRRDVWWELTDSPQPFSVRLRLARYRHGNEQWSTTGFPPGYGQPEKHLGYLLTKELPGSVPLFDCVKNKDHFISLSRDCDGGFLLRTLGWTFTKKATDRVGLFSCFGKERFESLSAKCENRGRLLGRLGFIPKQ